MADEELLDWARGRPLWQQDALRRLAQHVELATEDLVALRIQIQQEAGLPVENAPKPVPLAAEHLNRAASNDPKTVLASLGPVRHVDRLSSDQPPLRFAVNGITLVYGPNASGKSGYCRIAKQLCRSQSPAELRGNVYDVEAPDHPEVTVAFRVGGDDQPKEERVWSSNQEPPTELSRISVFDTATARVYVDKQRRIEFLPYELDLMNKLGLACRDLDNGFKESLGTVNAVVNTPLPEGYHEGTTVQAALASLVPSTVLSDLPSEQNLRELGTWTSEMQKEIAAIAEQLDRDPQVMIRLRTEAKQALEIIKDEISTIENNIADMAITDIRQSHQTAEVRHRAAEAVASDLFSDQPISDLGSSTWRQMLTYAREFAAIVFSDVSPPQLANGGLCVLCQQDLSDDAADRMTAFDDYIAGRAAEESVTAARLFAEHRDKLMIFKVRSRREVKTLLAGYAALSDDRKGGAATIAAFVEGAGERLETVKGVLQEERFDALSDVDPLPVSPAPLLENEISQLDDEIAELESVDRDEKGLADLQARHEDLSDRKRLSEEIEIIVERRNRLEERHRLDVCSKLCRLTAITRRITDRRRKILTPTLKTTLYRELERLRLTHIPLDLSDRGQDAESIIEVALSSQQRISNNSDILSEGEQRALALACFLSELHEIGSDHAIIVDDPVSSLDHGRMQAVAERLAEEASKGRQVIVFTHNILFYHMLWTETRQAGVGWHSEWMSSAGGDRFGLIDASKQPGQMKGVRQRLGEINQGFSKLTNNQYDHADQKFRPDIIGLYTKMRETWERTIEEILFNHAVQRFRPEIMTMRLEEACFDPSTDYPAIFEGMRRCSGYSGHDPASDLPSDLPEFDRISRDIKDLEDFVTAAIERRKKLKKSPSYEKGIDALLL